MKGPKRKVYNIRHGHGPRRGCNAVEKAIETVTRREGKRAALAPCETCGRTMTPGGVECLRCSDGN